MHPFSTPALGTNWLNDYAIVRFIETLSFKTSKNMFVL